ncbi:MAG: hypothetical protein JG776_1187 [Caloramator sp.]|jgi:hypothetical protein|uniref:hypothetical protein n=1 Tax=Caloramator sp. TaxID=1871330 RepID=UPI001DF9D4FF|nr:hypothetical protein [Caloramator sp.]MBZ4663484.1 hypothetical protein [Caloramator sp.]
MLKKCIIDKSKQCINCDECNICDLAPNKICDNCMQCLDVNKYDYKEIHIDGIIEEEDYDDYIYDEEILEQEDDYSILKDSIYIDEIE